jgi:hypothetical protein
MVRNNEEKRNDCTRLDGHEMNLKIKLLRWPETGNYVLAFCRGSLEREGFKEIFRRVDQFTHRLSDCRILIDIRDSNYILESTDIPIAVEHIVENFSSHASRLALVSAPGVECFPQLVVLSSCLSKCDFDIAVFTDIDRAASWLAAASFV